MAHGPDDRTGLCHRLFAGGPAHGEAGGNPASHSLIADLFPPTRRARAIAIYTLGAPIGSFLGAALVGWMAQELGWRQTFLWLGPPGLACALLVWWLMPSPPRGGFDAGLADVASDGQAEQVPTLRAVLRDLLGRSAFRHLVWGGSLVVLVGYGVPAAPLLVGGLLSGSLWLAVAGTFPGDMAICGYIAPAFAQVHRMATARSRATVTAVYYLITNLVGLGLGPPIIGAISDARARQIMGLDADAFQSLCLPVQGTPGHGCGEALAGGMTTALAMVHFLIVARKMRS